MEHSATNPPPRLLFVFAATVPLGVFLAVYVPAVGLGFISDDFRWVKESQLSEFGDVLRLFQQDNGFYRPLVSLSFGLNHLLAGINPHLYGLTNLGLAMLCGVLTAVLCMRIGLTTGASWFAAAIWLLNFHGINMALLWISGRTALILIVCSLAAAIAVVAGKPLTAALFAGCALFAKEEAVMLPLILVSWALILGARRTPGGGRYLAILVVALTIDLLLYFWLRSSTGAMTPATAPSFYQLTFEPLLLLRNLAEYADRALSFSLGVTLVALLLLRRSGTRVNLRPNTLWLAIAWYVGGYAITIWVPSRSSLYACFPALAGAIVAAEVCQSLWRQADGRRRCVALAAVVVVPILCFPAYVARNQRWTDLSRFSTHTLDYLTPHFSGLSEDTWLVLVDDGTDRVNLQSAFGALLPDAIVLRAGRVIKLWIEPPAGAEPTGGPGPCLECPRRRFIVHNRSIRLADR